MRPTSMSFEQRYSDDSGVEYAVRLHNNEIEFESIGCIRFPLEEIVWLIECLQVIKAQTETP